MYDGTADEIRVSFPAASDFHPVGMAAVSGLAMRLGVEVAQVENLRAATGVACRHLEGKGDIHLQVSWEPGHVAVDVENTMVSVPTSEAASVQDELLALVGEATVKGSHIGFAIEDSSA